jgi:hypothetical protein
VERLPKSGQHELFYHKGDDKEISSAINK